MEQYIKKSTLVVEIENWISGWTERLNNTNPSNPSFFEGGIEMGKHIRSFIDTLEAKELDNVWHDASETPKGAGDKEILVQFYDFHTSVVEIDDWEYLDHQTKWAYLKDLI